MVGEYPNNRELLSQKVEEFRELLDAIEQKMEGDIDVFDQRDIAGMFDTMSTVSGLLAAALIETIDTRTRPRDEQDEREDQ